MFREPGFFPQIRESAEQFAAAVGRGAASQLEVLRESAVEKMMKEERRRAEELARHLGHCNALAEDPARKAMMQDVAGRAAAQGKALHESAFEQRLKAERGLLADVVAKAEAQRVTCMADVAANVEAQRALRADVAGRAEHRLAEDPIQKMIKEQQRLAEDPNQKAMREQRQLMEGSVPHMSLAEQELRRREAMMRGLFPRGLI